MKILRFLRNTLIFIGWTYFFIAFSNALIDLIWRFDFLSQKSWNILSTFWNNGGILKTTSDVLLITSLFLLPILWFVGFILVKRFNYLKIFLFPFNLLCSPFRKNFSAEPKRIVLKNLKSSQQTTEDIKAEIEAAAKPKKSQEAENIRSQIIQKRTKNDN